MRRSTSLALAAAALLAGAAMAARWLLPGQIDARLNRVQDPPAVATDPAARALHDRLRVVDLHADPLLWERDLLVRNRRGQVDVPRLLEGNVTLQVFGVVTRVPLGANYERTPERADMITALAVVSGWPRSTWTSLRERALRQAAELDALAERAEGRLVVVRSAADLEQLLARRARGDAVVGGLLGLEGMHAAEGELAGVERLFEAGIRMFAPAHFFDNELGGSAAGVEKGGLTTFGFHALRRVEELGGIVDLAHASPRLVDEWLARATRPVVVSHTGVQATCAGPRNLSDEQVRRVAAGGGLIGVGVWDGAVCDTSPAATVRAMRHVRELVGVEHVALGSDFDGTVVSAFDASALAVLTEALLADGFSEEQVRAVMGGNALRLFAALLPGAPAP